MLNLAVYEPLPASEPAPPAKRRNPLIALLLSLVFPGLGHLYIGIRRNAAWIAGSELVFLAWLNFASGTLHANAVPAVPIMYCFAMADAYFSAREWNAGVTPLMIGANPRTTAILNLLTKGFGYFYLGDRTKGIVCFLVTSGAQGALLAHTNVWTSVLAISLQIAIAVDGYRVARQQLLKNHPELATVDSQDGTTLIDRANPGGLTPSFASAIFLLILTTVVLGYAVLRALSGRPISSRGSVEQGPEGLIYTNAQEKVTLTVPSNWSTGRSEGALVRLDTTGMSLIAQEQYAIYSAGSLLDSTQANLKQRHSDASFTPCVTSLGTRRSRCFETSYKNTTGQQIQQRIVATPRFLKMFILIETWTVPGQRQTLNEIEKNLKLL